MTTLYNVNKNFQGFNGFGAPFCDKIFTTTLGANTEATVTVPSTLSPGMAPSATTSNTFLAVFGYSAAATVFVAKNATAAVPAGNSLQSSTSEINPPAKIVKAGDVIHIVSAGTPSVSIAFYSTQSN